MDRDRTKQITEHAKPSVQKKTRIKFNKKSTKRSRGRRQWYTKICYQIRC